MEQKLDNESKIGTAGWIALAGVVGAWDVLADETLTNAYKRGREHLVGRVAVRMAALYTLAHLEDLIPEPYDIFDNLANYLGNKKNPELAEVINLDDYR